MSNGDGDLQSRMEEGTARSSPTDAETNRFPSRSVRDAYRETLRASLCFRRHPMAVIIAYVTAVICMVFMAVMRGYTIEQRTRQRISRGALEARLQFNNPGIELGRLRLLLVDRDFTGEDYQTLLGLDENNEVPSTAGASESEIRRNPSFVIKEPPPGSAEKPKNCTICLYPFKPSERVRIIPCLHQFHTENRNAPSGKSRVYQATQLRTDDVHYRESGSTEPVVLKVARLTGAAFSDIDELIARPLDVISRLRVELKERTDNSAGEDHKGHLAAAISDALCSGDYPDLERVPVLSRECLIEGKLPPNTLVRYRGMVQDQYEPEYFVGSFEEVHTATGQRTRVDVNYMDSIPQRAGFVNEFEGPGAKTMERLPVFCVPVPGVSPWAQPPPQAGKGYENDSQQQGASVGGPPKRPREAEDAMDCTDEGTSTPGEQPDATVPIPQAKAQRATGNEIASTDGGAKSAVTGAFHHGQELELEGLACLVKLYDYKEGDLKLNDNAEFVGVLGYDQPLPSQEDGQVGSGDPFQGLSEFSRKVPPPSLAPRLHCIFYRAMTACAPLSVDPEQPKDALHALQGPLPFGAFMLDTKRRAIAHLASALGGDALAAEYALLTILSRAYVRTESSAPGSLTLNLRGVSADDVPGFHAVIADMVPKCVTVPITTQSLSEKFKFSPKKDYDADRLMLSYLQLSEGTVVLLDETRLESGQIGVEGVKNTSALKSLLSVQKIPYDFGFYKMDFDVDHPTIALSSRGSVVPTGAVVPVVASGETTAVSDAATLSRLRVYVEATRRMQLSLDEFSSAFAEEDFVKARQQGHGLTGDDFHMMLTIARLTALSLGDGMMNASHWNHMKDLKARVAGRAQRSGAERASQAASATLESPNHAAASLNAIPEDA